MKETASQGLRTPRPGVAVLVTDVAFEIRRLEKHVQHDITLTPALSFWALYRVERRRCEQGIPSEPSCVHDALRELVAADAH